MTVFKVVGACSHFRNKTFLKEVNMSNDMQHTEVKFCGLTTIEDVREVNFLLPNYAGMVMFYPKSKRNLTPEQAEELLSSLSPKIHSVAVTVSPTMDEAKKLGKMGFEYLQVHGTFDAALLKKSPLPLILAFNGLEDPEQKESLAEALENPLVYGILFDAPSPGSGKTFNWAILPKKEELVGKDGMRKKMFLSGGLNPENVTSAIEAVHPDVVDVSTGIEGDQDPLNQEKKGKDPEKMREFMSKTF